MGFSISSQDRLRQYVEEYFCEELRIKYQLSFEGSQLKLYRQDSSSADLQQILLNLFRKADNCFDFIFGDLNQVIGFNLNAGGGRVRSIYFKKQ